MPKVFKWRGYRFHFFSNEVIQMKYKDPCTHVKLKRKNKTATISNDYEDQIRLENYGMVV